MIPISTPSGPRRVWTKRIGNNPDLKVPREYRSDEMSKDRKIISDQLLEAESDGAVLVLNALLGLGTALAPVFAPLPISELPSPVGPAARGCLRERSGRRRPCGRGSEGRAPA